MRANKKKTKKKIKIQDLEPRENPNGGMPQGPPKDTKWILKQLQLAQDPAKNSNDAHAEKRNL